MPFVSAPADTTIHPLDVDPTPNIPWVPPSSDTVVTALAIAQPGSPLSLRVGDTVVLCGTSLSGVLLAGNDARITQVEVHDCRRATQVGVVQNFLRNPARCTVLTMDGRLHELVKNDDGWFHNDRETLLGILARNPEFRQTILPEPGDRYTTTTGRQVIITGLEPIGEATKRLTYFIHEDDGDWDAGQKHLHISANGQWKLKDAAQFINRRPATPVPALANGQIWRTRSGDIAALCQFGRVYLVNRLPENFWGSNPIICDHAFEDMTATAIGYTPNTSYSSSTATIVELAYAPPSVEQAHIIFQSRPGPITFRYHRERGQPVDNARSPIRTEFSQLTQQYLGLEYARYNQVHCDRCNTAALTRTNISTPRGLENWCERCTDDYAHREDCGHYTIDYSEVDHDDYEEPDDMCYQCNTAANRDVIQSHSYKPNPIFHGDDKLQFGVELELEYQNRGSTPLVRVAKECTIPTFNYVKRDGSLSGSYGLETVTHPFSLPWAKANQPIFEQWFAAIAKHGGTAPENCGMHIHTSKAGYGALPSTFEPKPGMDTNKRAIQLGLLRVQRLVYENPNHIIHFAGRKSDGYASLAKRHKSAETGLVGQPRAVLTMYRDHHHTSNGRGTNNREIVALSRDPSAQKAERYSALNFLPHTVEFRIYASTPTLSVLMSKIEFTHAVITYCKGHRLALKPSFQNFAIWMKDQRAEYPNLFMYHDTVITRLAEGATITKATASMVDSDVASLGVPAPVAPPDSVARTPSPTGTIGGRARRVPIDDPFWVGAGATPNSDGTFWVRAAHEGPPPQPPATPSNPLVGREHPPIRPSRPASALPGDIWRAESGTSWTMMPNGRIIRYYETYTGIEEAAPSHHSAAVEAALESWARGQNVPAHSPTISTSA